MTTATSKYVGRIPGLSEDQYNAAAGVRCTTLKDIADGGTAGHALAASPETTAALSIGSACHILTCRRDSYADDVVHAPGKKGYGSRETKAYAEFADEHPDKIILLDSERVNVEIWAQAARAHPKVRRFLEAGVPEVSYFGHDDEFGLDLKNKNDWEMGTEVIDFKWMVEGNAREWYWKARKFRYPMQQAYYAHGMQVVTGKVPSRFYSVVTDKTYCLQLHKAGYDTSWAVAIYEFTDRDLDEGAQQWRDALGIWKAHLDAENAGLSWAGYSQSVQEIAIY